MNTSHRIRLGVLAAGLVLVAVLAGVAWHRWAAVRPLPLDASLDDMRGRFGPKEYSQQDEETLIRTFFNDRREGVFLDVGASHHEKDSNTYFLEQRLGWRGIAIDALGDLAPGYAQYRPRTRFFNFFVTNESGRTHEFHVYAKDTRISSGDLQHLRALPGIKERHIQTTQVPSVTLDAILTAERVAEVDYVNLDIEGHELEALEGFDIRRYQPELLSVEAQPHLRAKLLAWFRAHGYERVEEFADDDPVNFWFRPA
jgi:FkbM family methyltransferase